MKDYTKYDFAAIKGAYVEMDIAPVENPTIHVAINGIIVYQDPKLILVLRNNATVTCFFRSEILSLSAKIKVEDMTIKQLRSQEKYKDFLCSSNFAQEALAHGNINVFDGYIDCTDWGWRK